MTEVRTRDEAFAAIDAGLARWAVAAADLLARATATASGVQAEAEAEAVHRSRRVTELADLLAALQPEDKLRPVVAANLARAKESLAAAQRAGAGLADVAARTAGLQRSQVVNTVGFVEAARADLARRSSELGAYRAAGAGVKDVLGASLGGLAGPGRGTASAPSVESWLPGHGLSDLDVAQAGFADNPITGTFGRGGLTRADYRWAVSTWDELVRPGLDRGITRDHFAARDAASGAPRCAGRRTSTTCSSAATRSASSAAQTARLP